MWPLPLTTSTGENVCPTLDALQIKAPCPLLSLRYRFAFQFFEIAFVGLFSFLFLQGVHFGVVASLQFHAVEPTFRWVSWEFFVLFRRWNGRLRNELLGSLCLRPGIGLLYGEANWSGNE